jgi:hypothetical protein
MTRLTALARFLWEFVIGDDWRIALAVVIAVALTAVVADAGTAAWWILPAAVAAVLTLSVRRAG